MKKWLFLLSIALMLTPVLTNAAAQDDEIRIGALVKTLSNPYFVRMAQGYEFAAARYGVTIEVADAPTEDATDEQYAILEGWLDEGDFDAFIVSPLRATLLNPLLAQAAERGIAVINVDELIPPDAAEMDGLDIATRIASNNVRAGSIAAQYLINLVGGGTDAAVIEGNPAAQSSIDRVSGFIDTAEMNGMRVVASQPANWDSEMAYEVAQDLLAEYPTLNVIFAANDTMGLGAIQSIEDAGRAGDIFVVSVDAIPDALQAVEDGRLAGTVAQFPEEMAILAVEAALKVLDGRPIAPEIESPVAVITAENLHFAQNQLRDPDIGDIQIGALTKETENEFFVRMIEGYNRAAADFGIEIEIGSTERANMSAEQQAILMDWLESGGFDGMIVTPFRPNSLNNQLAQLSANAIPIINIDELIPIDVAEAADLNIATRIASNNIRAGRLAAEFVIEQVGTDADVAVLEGAPGTQSSIDRVSGFIDTVEAAGMRVVASQPANWEENRAYDQVVRLLGNMPTIRVIFAANDAMALGAIRAIENAGRAGDIFVVGVDGTSEAVEAVREGRLAATVAQSPDEMAYLAVETMIKVLEGRPVAPFIESPVRIITAESLSD